MEMYCQMTMKALPHLLVFAGELETRKTEKKKKLVIRAMCCLPNFVLRIIQAKTTMITQLQLPLSHFLVTYCTLPLKLKITTGAGVAWHGRKQQLRNIDLSITRRIQYLTYPKMGMTGPLKQGSSVQHCKLL